MSGPTRAGWFAALTASIVTLAAASASQADAFGTCVERALAVARGKGGKVFGRPRDAFLVAPDAFVSEYSLPGDGCLGFVFAGRRHSQGLWLTLYDADGRAMAAKTEPGVYGYLRACGARGTPVVAELRMRDGGGEARLQAIWDAPASLSGLSSVMETCRGIGVPRPGLVDVGPEPIGLPMASNLERLSRRLWRKGYAPVGPPGRGDLPNLRRDIRRVSLRGDRCYALAAVGGSDVIDIDLRVFESEESPRLVTSESRRSNEAIVKFCAVDDGDRLVDVRMYEGGGPYLIQVYELPYPERPLPPGAEGSVLIGLKEAEVLFRRRGMRIRDAQWLLLPAHQGQRVPVALGPGCYGFALVAKADPAPQDLQMGVTDGSGNLLASDMGSGGVPVAYLCSGAEPSHAVIARAPSTPRPVQALLVIAEDDP